MIGNHEIKETFTSYLKTQSTLVPLVSGSHGIDIREFQWMGTDFDYPNVRFRVIDNLPIQECKGSDITASCMVFSESLNSLEADRIADIIKDILHNKSFSSNGYAISGSRVTALIPAIVQEESIWRSEVMLKAKITQPS